MTKLITKLAVLVLAVFSVNNLVAQDATLPLDFEDATLTYVLVGFGGNDGADPIPTEIVANPDMSGENTSATIWHINKAEGAAPWAGAHITLGAAIDFTAGEVFSMKVWSPRAGVPILFKIESLDGDGNPTSTAEISSNTTVANTWEVLTFDFSAVGGFSAAIDYHRVVAFPDFNNPSMVGGESYFFDDVMVIGGGMGNTSPVIPVDFEDDAFTYNLAGFGDATPERIDNPDASGVNTSLKVVSITKAEGAPVWAGISLPLGADIDLSSGSMFSMNVWSPNVGDTIMLKFEDLSSPPDGNGNPSIITEVKRVSTVANAWETLTYDMSEHPGYAAANMYDQLVVFADFGRMGVAGGATYFIDDIINVPVAQVLATIPVDFEDDALSYNLAGFGAADFGAIPAERIDNPDASGENTSSKVVSITKPEGAQVWAGASMPLGAVIDLSNGPGFSMQVWSPNAGEIIMLKFEDTTSPPDGDGNPSIITEVQRTTSVAGAWETLTYDMSEHPGYDAANNYNQVVVFPNFGQMGVAGGATYFIDNIQGELLDATEEQLRSIGQLEAFPNPVKDQININYEIINRGNISFTLVDILGKTVSAINAGQVNTGSYTEQIDVNTISDGTYFLVMKFDGEVVRHQKLIIQK